MPAGGWYLLQQLRDGVDELIGVEGLGEEASAVREDAGLDAGIVGEAADEENARGRMAEADAVGEVTAGHAGHAHVGDEEVERFFAAVEERKRLLAGGSVGDGESFAFEDAADDGADAGLIVDDKGGAPGWNWDRSGERDVHFQRTWLSDLPTHAGLQEFWTDESALPGTGLSFAGGLVEDFKLLAKRF